MFGFIEIKMVKRKTTFPERSNTEMTLSGYLSASPPLQIYKDHFRDKQHPTDTWWVTHGYRVLR